MRGGSCWCDLGPRFSQTHHECIFLTRPKRTRAHDLAGLGLVTLTPPITATAAFPGVMANDILLVYDVTVGRRKKDVTAKGKDAKGVWLALPPRCRSMILPLPDIYTPRHLLDQRQQS